MEPMNVTAQHPQLKVSLQFSDPSFVAGQDITGKFVVQSLSESNLAIGAIKAELFAVQDLTSRDHSATNTFIHKIRSFQGPLLPPSNAVYPRPLPDNYYPARKGETTFFFRFSTPTTTPASIDFAKGLAKLSYHVRSTIAVQWNNLRQLVSDTKQFDLLEYPGEPSQGIEQVVIGENGKLWAQARILSSYLLSGQSACIQLFVKNHSIKKTSSLSLSLTRHLQLDAAARPNKILQISDSLLNIPFRGQEYIVQPGTEGVANLVFTLPKAARGVRSGPIYVEDGDELPSLFHVQCLLTIKIGMGLTSKDVNIELPVNIVHPTSLAAYGIQDPQTPPSPQFYSPPFSPQPPLYWSPPIHDDLYQWNYPPILPRPISADPYSAQPLPAMPEPQNHISTPINPQHNEEIQVQEFFGKSEGSEGEIGKGERASRISARLHRSSRNRSVSPLSHRFPLQQQQLQSTTYVILGDNSPDSDSHSPHTRVNTRTSLSPGDTHPHPITLLHAPRPMLSPKHSFVLKNGRTANGKSSRVEELEKMAEIEFVENWNELAARDHQGQGQGQGQGQDLELEEDTTPNPPELPRLAPIRPRLSYRNGTSGLDALERRLMQQVGTKKPKSDRRTDVRTILHPTASQNDDQEQTDPPNDSAISSLSLGEDKENEGHVKEETNRPSDATVRPIRAITTTTTDPINHSPEGKAKEYEKRVEVHQLRKAATSRVAAWLDTIDPSVIPSPTPTETTATTIPSMIQSTTSTSSIVEREDTSTTPVNTVANAITSQEQEELLPVTSSTSGKVPTRSSGFVLRRSQNGSEAFDEPSKEQSTKDTDDSRTRNIVPTIGKRTSIDRQNLPVFSGPSPSRNIPNRGPLLPLPSMKPVLKRYAYGRDASGHGPSSSNDVDVNLKYPVESTRGGRGGKVTSVAAIWTSFAEDQRKVSNGSSEGGSSTAIKRATPPPPTTTIPNTPAAGQVTKTITINANPKLKKTLNAIQPNTNLIVDSSKGSPRPAYIKSPSVPAAISSSIARPLLSSTASLARPPGSDPSSVKKLYPPSVSSINSSASNSDTQPGKVPKFSAGEMAFGQARLKDLIRKYQQGV